MRSNVKGMRCVSVLLLVASGLLPVVQAAPGPTFQGDARAVAELRAFYSKLADQKSWRSRMALPGATPVAVTSEFVAPDRMHLIMSQGAQTLGEYFLIGNTMYVKSGRDCTKLPQKVTLPNPREHMQPDPDAVIQVIRGGAEVVEGTPTQTYAVTTTSQGKTGRQKMYAATATGLPRRLEVSSNEGPIVIDYLDFGAGVTISGPPC